MGRRGTRGQGSGRPFSEREVKKSLYKTLMGIPHGPDTDLWAGGIPWAVGGGALGYAHQPKVRSIMS